MRRSRGQPRVPGRHFAGIESRDEPRMSETRVLRRGMRMPLWPLVVGVGAVVLWSLADPSDDQRPTLGGGASAEETTTTTTPDTREEFRYDYDGDAAICRVSPEQHVVAAGDTLYGLVVDEHPKVDEYEMYMLLPAIRRLNIERQMVDDPDVLAINDEVLTLQDCKIYQWINVWGGFVRVNDVETDVVKEYRYDFDTKEWGDMLDCRGDDKICTELGFPPPDYSS